MNSQVHRQHPGWKRRAAVQAILGHNAAKGAVQPPAEVLRGQKASVIFLPPSQVGDLSPLRVAVLGHWVKYRPPTRTGCVDTVLKDLCGRSGTSSSPSCHPRPGSSTLLTWLSVRLRKTSIIRASITSVSSRFPFRGVATETATLCPPSAGRSDVAKASDRAGAGQPSINDVRD